MSNIITVKDLISGSALHITSSNLGDITGPQYAAATLNLGTGSAIKQEHLPQIMISPSLTNSNTSGDITIKNTEISKFSPGTKPTTKFYNFEKSMYQVISDRMLEFMAGIEGFNEFIGSPVNKYRTGYKSLDKLKQEFFDKVENDLDLDRFVEYYRWIDGSISNFLNQLAPATANLSSKLRNTVDSHLLERNKYIHQAPTIEFKFNEDTHSIFGINELLYNWRLGHNPLENIDSSNCLWGQERRELEDRLKIHANIVESLRITNATNFVSFGDNALWTPYTDFTFGGNYFANPRGVIWSFYVKIEDTSIDNILVEKEDEFTIKALTGGHLFVRFGKDANNVTIQKNSVFTLNQWHHVLIHEQKHTGASFDASSLVAYLDGQLIDSMDTRAENGTYRGIVQGDGSNVAFDDTDEDLIIMKGKLKMVDLVYAVNGASAESSKFTSKAKNIDFFRRVDPITQIPVRVNYISELVGVGNEIPLLADGATESTDQMLAYWPLSNEYYADGANGVKDRINTNHGAASDASTANLELDSPYRPQSTEIPLSSVNTVRRIITTEISGSTYARRALVKPFRIASDFSPATIEKIDSAQQSYKLVDTDNTNITISGDKLIRERDHCKTIATDNFDDGKYEYDAKILIGGEPSNTKIAFPISFNSSSIINQINQFKSGVEITNLPENQNRFILQGPYTSQHVGSKPHRKQSITTGQANRQEAYKFDINTNSITMSAIPIRDPHSTFARGIGVASPYSIENIRFGTGSDFIGNYQESYETVLISGRSSANVQLIKDGGLTDVFSNSLFLSGVVDYVNIDRGKNKHVISSIFNAPGGPETSPALTGDREIGEFSIYNSINYRNLFPVRDANNSLLGKKSEKFGIVSSSLGPTSGASVHKTQRNTRYRTEILTDDGLPILTASFDNAFVAKPIPQNAFQYSWITASLSGSAANFINTNDGYGYVHEFYNKAGSGENALKLNLKSPERMEIENTLQDSCLGFLNNTGLTKRANIHFDDAASSKYFSLYNASSGEDESFTISFNIMFLDDDPTAMQNIFQRIGSDSSGYRFSVSMTGIEVFLHGQSSTANIFYTRNFDNILSARRFYNITIVYNASNPVEESSVLEVHVDGVEQDNGFIAENSATAYRSAAQHQQTDVVADLVNIGAHNAGQNTTNSLLYDLYLITPAIDTHEIIEINKYSKSLRLNKESTQLSSSIEDNTYKLSSGIFPNDYHSNTGSVSSVSDLSFADVSGTGKIKAYYRFSGSFPFTGDETQGPTYSSPNYASPGAGGPAPHFTGSLAEDSCTVVTAGITRHIAKSDTKFYKRNHTFTDLLPHYSWNSWNQVRGSEHPVTRKLNKENKISVVSRNSIPNIPAIDGYKFDPNKDISTINDDIFTEGRIVQSYIEPAANLNNYPIKIIFHGENRSQVNRSDIFTEEVNRNQPRIGLLNYNPLEVSDALESRGFYSEQNKLERIWDGEEADIDFSQNNSSPLMVASITYQNNLLKFSNKSLSNLLKLPNDSPVAQELLTNINQPIQVSYTEAIYPRKEFVGLNKIRTREKFDFYGWKKDIDKRQVTLTGSLAYLPEDYAFQAEGNLLFPSGNINLGLDINLRNSVGIDAVSFVSASSPTFSHIKSSKWPLDGPANFSTGVRPRNIKSLGPKELSGSYGAGGQLGEGELMNDYSIFHNQHNKMHLTPPPAMLYSRRVVQHTSGTLEPASISDLILAGTTPWLAAAQLESYPYFDTHEERTEVAKRLAKDYSIIPEFRISDHVEKVINELDSDFSQIGKTEETGNYLTLTGSSLDASSTEFYKVYSTSDFMEYFQVIKEDNSDSLEPYKITLRCDAVLNFIPYEGFYPAQRAIQIGKIFSDNYMKSGKYEKVEGSGAASNGIAAVQKKVKANLQQSMKPLFSPGVLFNSIKSGIAVDYPIFNTSFGPATGSFNSVSNPSGLLGTSSYWEGRYKFDKHYFSDERKNEIVFESGITGSHVNHTSDAGIPRLTGSVSRRVTFEDLLDPSRLEKTIIFDNEPHPSASILYGNSSFEEVFDRPFIFGHLNSNKTLSQLGTRIISQPNLREDLKSYRMAINNFCAETTNFFIEDSFTTLETKGPAFEGSRFFNQGDSYEMNIKLKNNDIMMYDRHSAFGPPVDEHHPKFLDTITTEVSIPASKASTRIGLFPSFKREPLRLNLASGSLPGFKIKFAPPADDDNFCKTIEFKFFDGSRYSFGTPGFSDDSHSFLSESAGDHNDHKFNNNTDTESRTTYIDIQGGNAPTFTSHVQQAIDKVLDELTNQNVANLTSIRKRFSSGADSELIGHDFFFGVEITHQTASAVGNLTISDARGLVPIANVRKEDFFWGNIGFNFSDNSVEDHPFIRHSAMLIRKEGSFVGGVDAIDTVTSNTVFPIQTGSHGYLPYVPPFLDPGTEPSLKVVFKPTESREYNLDEVLQNLQLTSSIFLEEFSNELFKTNGTSDEYQHVNFNTASLSGGDSNFAHAMTLSSSLDLLGWSLYKQDFDSENNSNATKENSTRWVIQTKWETPVLDFKSSEAETINLSNNEVSSVSTSFWKERNQLEYYSVKQLPREDSSLNTEYLTASRGMWHQGGQIPESNGYTLEISNVEGIPESRQLALKAGFLSDTETSVSKPVGKLKKEQKICEAVVAIPFYINSRNSRKYLRIRNRIINKAKDLNRNLSKLRGDISYDEYFNNPGQTPVETVAYQLRMMEKYVFPPEFDFLKHPTGAHRQSMFIFQFNAALNQEDLRNVWQNVMPTSQQSSARARFSVNAEDAGKFTSPFSAFGFDDGAQRDTKIISVFLDSENNSELLSNSRYKYLNNDIKWIVFKVKKRAKSSVLEEKQASLPASKTMELASSYVTRNPDFDDYTKTIKKASYNWPYDYFSLVELVKVKAKADFATKNTTGAIVESD